VGLPSLTFEAKKETGNRMKIVVFYPRLGRETRFLGRLRIVGISLGFR